MRPIWYNLSDDGRAAVPVADGYLPDELDERAIVGRTTIESRSMFVSTVFLRVDHQFGDGAPLLWETMVFPVDAAGKVVMGRELLCRRYSSRDAADAGHADVVAMCERGDVPKRRR